MSIWRSTTEISYELAATPLFYQKQRFFYSVPEEKDVELLRQMCRFWQPAFLAQKIISEKFIQENEISEKQYQDLQINLTEKQSIAISAIIKKLIALDFTKNKTANIEKCFAVRGDILDIFYNEPLRIEFANDKIEKIYSFSLLTNKKIKNYKQLNVYPEKIPPSALIIREEDLKYEYISPKFYNRRYLELNHDLKKFLKIIISTTEPEKIRKIINQRVIIFENNLPLTSFILPAENTIFLTDENIFGVPLKEEKREIDEDFIKNLKSGDFLVHIDHGVALFRGYKTINQEKFFWLQYAKQDKLFVPASSACRIEKYIGSAKPKLHRLDDASWEQIINKIKKKTEVIAKELLLIHANRLQSLAPMLKETEAEKEIADSFSYSLTKDQEQAIIDTLADLALEKPADRLVCGDVGFGKTEVAIRAAARAVFNNYQVAILCPTTILVQQHYDTFYQRLHKFGINIELLSRFRTVRQQKTIVEKIKSNRADIIIATHRLLSADIAFKKIGLIIVDEEQKFGVKHKEFLKKISQQQPPHILTLTATPIPRTLNLALSGLKEISTIRTPPPHRLHINTIIAKESDEIINSAIKQELQRNGQVYFLYNQVETIGFVYKKLAKIFPQIKIAIAHGQMEPKKLAQTMHEFDQGLIKILICSTIIENGLDIANANTLIVHQAPNFGLSQLHQIRGRIGRWHQKAYAYFLYRDEIMNEEAKKRLKILQEFSNPGSGMEIAMKDLEIRGVGNILGKDQSGQAKEIGLNLYLRLLNNAISELKK